MGRRQNHQWRISFDDGIEFAKRGVEGETRKGRKTVSRETKRRRGV